VQFGNYAPTMPQEAHSQYPYQSSPNILGQLQGSTVQGRVEAGTETLLKSGLVAKGKVGDVKFHQNRVPPSQPKPEVPTFRTAAA
jgi:hypothetical protein